MENKIHYRGITFDDVLLEPRYSELVPSEVDVTTKLTRRIHLNIPQLSDGYRDGKCHGYRFGAGRRFGHHP